MSCKLNEISMGWINLAHLLESDKGRVEQCIAQYARLEESDAGCGSYIIYRVWNAVKAVFGYSDWQIASRLISNRLISLIIARDPTIPRNSVYLKDCAFQVNNIGIRLLSGALAAQEIGSSSLPMPIDFIRWAWNMQLQVNRSVIGSGAAASESREAKWASILASCPEFKEYRIGQGTSFEGGISGLSIRPANLLFASLGVETTMPGSSSLFSFINPGMVRDQIQRAHPDLVVEVSAVGKKCRQHGSRGQVLHENAPLESLFGTNTCRISYQELQDTLRSQKIYCSAMLPKEIYQGLKQALLEDHVVTLPGKDATPCKLKDLPGRACQAFIASLPKSSFFTSVLTQLPGFLDLSIYQLGAMVVKTEDYYLLTDGNGQLFSRQVGDQDVIRLINACGIRGIAATSGDINTRIMQSTFEAALYAATGGFVVFPAVGMGVWRGGPEVYWPAFLAAVESSKADDLETIFVNPRHQRTTFGPYQGSDGSELAVLLAERIQHLSVSIESTGDAALKMRNQKSLKNLQKIVNLYENKTDLLQLAYQLKRGFPEATVSIFNASDPDVTLGNHVTEYSNNCPHPAPTTEEHYSMMGTNGLCFESITGVHEDPNRIIQVSKRA